MDPQVSLEHVQSQYLLELKDVIQAGPRLFKIVGPAGVYKGYVDTPRSAALRMFFTDGVSKEGFRHTPRLLLNRHHERILQLSDSLVFYLTDDMRGEPVVSPVDVETVYSLGACLARLHESLRAMAEHIPTEVEGQLTSRYGGWQQHFLQGHQFLLAKGQHTEAHFAAGALQLLKISKYQILCGTAKKQQEIAWNGVDLDSFRVDTEVSLTSIQYRRKPMCVEQIYDLCTVAADLSTMASVEAIDALLDGYGATRPLDKQARAVVYACALFPHLLLYEARQSVRTPGKLGRKDEKNMQIEQYRRTATQILKRLQGV